MVDSTNCGVAPTYSVVSGVNYFPQSRCRDTCFWKACGNRSKVYLIGLPNLVKVIPQTVIGKRKFFKDLPMVSMRHLLTLNQGMLRATRNKQQSLCILCTIDFVTTQIKTPLRCALHRAVIRSRWSLFETLLQPKFSYRMVTKEIFKRKEKMVASISALARYFSHQNLFKILWEFLCAIELVRRTIIF